MSSTQAAVDPAVALATAGGSQLPAMAIGFALGLAVALLAIILLRGARQRGLVGRTHTPDPGLIDRQRLAAIVDSSTDAIVGKTLDGVITSWNRAAEQLFGYRADEIVGQSVQTLIPADRADEEARIQADLANGRKVEPFDTVRTAKDGRHLSVSLSVSPILDASGRVVGAAKIVRDLSAHQRIESELRESRVVLGMALRDNDSLLRTIHAHFIVSIADAVGTITDVNDRFCVISGYARDELIGQNHRIINSGVQPRHFWLSMWQDIAAGRPWRGEICNRAKDGSLYWVDSVISPFVDDHGQVQKYISIRTDITAAKRAESARLLAERLAAENRQILEANRLKGLFVANMSHELRTPLNAVIGFADLLRSGAVEPTSPKHSQFLGHIASSGRHLLQLINDVLDLSKVESGKLEFVPELLDLRALATDVVNVLTNTWQGKDIAVDMDIDDDLGPLQLDPSRLRQVLYNYLSNAFKFTPRGGRVTVRARPEGETHFRLEVQDNGPGISALDLPRLFVEFQQLDSGHAKLHQGTGLGLALTRRLVRAQGGNVGVRSVEGEGSIFHLVLPCQQLDAQAAGVSLLMIESSHRLFARMAGPLSQAGFGVDVADEGLLAARLARQRPYDAITLDVLMPHPGGLDIVPALRQRGPSSRTPIVAVTMSDHRGEAAYAITDLLSKPMHTGEVQAAMSRLRQTLPGRISVMVVDDDPQARALMQGVLEAMGIGVVLAEGGRAAMQAVDRQVPDAMVLDLMMPEMDGFEVLHALRAHPLAAAVPVFIWTSLILTPQEQELLAGSARAILAKGDGALAAVLDSLRLWQPMPVLSVGPA